MPVNVPSCRERFEQIREILTKMLVKFGYKEGISLAFVPVAGYLGDNLARHSTNMPWYFPLKTLCTLLLLLLLCLLSIPAGYGVVGGTLQSLP